KYDDTQHHALEDINLSMYDGEHIALIGKSGAGKSTLAQVIAQHFKPQFGSVIYKQQLKIGFLSQHPYIFNASIRDNMTMFQKIDEDKILEALDEDRKSTRLNSSHVSISYAVFCLKNKNMKLTKQ